MAELVPVLVQLLLLHHAQICASVVHAITFLPQAGEKAVLRGKGVRPVTVYSRRLVHCLVRPISGQVVLSGRDGDYLSVVFCLNKTFRNSVVRNMNRVGIYFFILQQIKPNLQIVMKINKVCRVPSLRSGIL